MAGWQRFCQGWFASRFAALRGTGSGPHINSVKAGFWSASLVVKPNQKDEPSVATAWGSFVTL